VSKVDPVEMLRAALAEVGFGHLPVRADVDVDAVVTATTSDERAAALRATALVHNTMYPGHPPVALDDRWPDVVCPDCDAAIEPAS
jgi:hypothetical protein